MRPPFTQGHSHDSLVVIETSTLIIIIIIIIIIRRLVTRAMSEYMTESEERAVARWDVGPCLRLVHKTKQVGFEPVFEVCTVGAFLMAAGISFQILGAQ